MAEPSRRLTPKQGQKPLRYVPSHRTDIRTTFRRARRLAALQASQKGAA